MTPQETQMRREVLEIPVAVDRLLENGGDDIRRAAEAIRARSPNYMISVARGSSDMSQHISNTHPSCFWAHP